MKWPWSKPEKRASSFTDEIVSRILARASASTAGDPGALWALECAANFYSRAFAAAKVSGDRAERISPSMLALMGRNLIRRGEGLHLIETRRGEVDFLPAGGWDIRGGASEESWRYRLDFYGPSGQSSRFVSSGAGATRSLCRRRRDARGMASAPCNPQGKPGRSRRTSKSGLARRRVEPLLTFCRFRKTEGAARMTIPSPCSRPISRARRGRTILTETTAAAWGEGMSAAPKADWKANRLGAHPPDVLRGLRSEAGMAVLSACGVPVSLATDADGTSQRESWRRFVMGAVEPLLEIVGEELERKLETTISFDLTGLWAHDLQGRASAFQKMVQGGMALEQAAAASGVLNE